MGGSEKDFCIKCDKGGKVLSCSDSSCPIAVHEKCLGFPAKFDEVGNFYCPYCSYRRATEESHQAREKALFRKKALSSFIDMKMINGGKHMHENGKSEHKELGKLHNTSKGNYNPESGNESKLDQATIQKNPVQPEKEQEEDEFAPDRRVSLYKEINTVLLGKENNALSSKYGDNARPPSDCNERIVVVGHRTPSGPIVACGQDVYSEEEESENHFEMVEIGRWNRLEHHKQLKNDEAANTASFATDPATLVALEEEEGFESTDILCRVSDPTTASKHVKNDKQSGYPSDVNCLKRSCRISSSALKANVKQIEELTTPTELKQLTEPSPVFSQYMFPSVRRKKLLWKDEEEEMLREGVQKYSSTDSKNIPWRKILEFGRHVFHDTRTPSDLKDKWRNMLAKER